MRTRRLVTLGLALLLFGLLGATLGLANRQWYPIATLRSRQAAVVAVRFVPDSGTAGIASTQPDQHWQRAVTLDASGKLIVWNLKQRQAVDSIDLAARFSGQLKAGKASVTLSPDGTMAAASAPKLGTVVWRVGVSDAADIPIRHGWTPIMGLSHDNTMLGR